MTVTEITQPDREARSVDPGRRFVRPDGVAKVTGQASYTADLQLTGMLHAAFRYSDHAHARVVAVETTAAERLPGVLAVITQRDVPAERHGVLVRDRPLFADGVVRFEGDIVAAVAATTPAIAHEASRLIRVEYEPLPEILDAEAALEEGAPLVHAEWEQYDALPGVRHGNVCSHPQILKGDVGQALADAEVVVEERYEADVSHPVPIEPHAVVAQWEGDKVTIWTTSQVPFAARGGVAQMLRIPESSVRVIVPHLGGGFGGKCEFHFEAHIAALARKAGRPVRLVLDRREEFVATDMTRHGMSIGVTTGARRDGTIVARRVRVVLDAGAYSSHSPAIADVATMIAAGAYRIPNLHVEVLAVYTNRTPAGSTRAPSGPQICWAIEQHTDVLAEKVGLDPIEFRRRNLVEDGDEGPTRQILDSVGARECLERAAELIGWEDGREPDEGVGVACGWWFSNPMPSGAYLKLNQDGSATVITGAQENGSGAVMGLPLLVASELGIEPEKVSLRYQDTDGAPWDLGSAGSQTTFNNGRAVLHAADLIRQRLLDLAEDELEAGRDDLELVEGQVRVRDAPETSVDIQALAQKAFLAGELLVASGAPPAPAAPQHDPSTCEGRLFMPSFAAPSFFCHAVRVKVDRETGVVRVLDAAAVHDIGRVVNPTGALGQVEGGVVHGLGIALTEGTVFHGGRQANPNLLDYKLQTVADVPNVVVDFVGRPAAAGGPYGAKGAGEPPVVPPAGAAANAIAQATGVRLRRLPMTPVRLWGALQGNDG